MSVKIDDVTFEQIDELAKEIYVGLLTSENSVTKPLEEAYLLAGNWFLSKDKRFNLWNDFKNRQVAVFYYSKENRDNTGWYEPELEREGGFRFDRVTPLNVQQHGKEIGSLENGARYWVIGCYDDSVPEIGVFDQVTSQNVYQFKTKRGSFTETISIKAILPKKIEP